MSRFLTREDILAVPDLGVVEVEVPDWAPSGESVSVYVRKLDGAGRQELGKVIGRNNVTETDIEQEAFVACVCNQEGVKLFSRADLPAIAAKFGGAVARVGRKALLINKFGKAALEEAEKN